MQLQAVEKAPPAAKRAPIHDHIDHCLGTDGETDLAETTAPAKPLRSAPAARSAEPGRPARNLAVPAADASDRPVRPGFRKPTTGEL